MFSVKPWTFLLVWLWKEANVVFNGQHIRPVQLDKETGRVLIGWQDNEHICVNKDAISMYLPNFRSFLEDSRALSEKPLSEQLRGLGRDV